MTESIDRQFWRNGRDYGRRYQASIERYNWLKLFVYVYAAAFLTFATVYVLVTWL